MNARASIVRQAVPIAFGTACLLALVALVEALIKAGMINSFIVPLPSEVVLSFRRILVDEQTRLLLGDKVLQIQQQLKQTMLLITHNITEAVQLSDRILVMTYRPGRIKRVVDIKLPRPRTSEIVSSEAFGHYVALIWSDLREEATKGMRDEESQKLREGDKR